MRLSKFQKMILFYFINIIIILIFSNITITEKFSLWGFIRVMSIVLSSVLILFFSILDSDSLRDIINFKYKLIKNKYDYSVKVLTIWWLFIPYWKPVKETYHTFESQNLFGATIPGSYTTENKFDKREEALSIIEESKKEYKKNREEFFKRPIKENKQIEYF